MRYYPRLGIFKASNVTFNQATLEAYSYGWWRFVSVIEGKLIFNAYRYSNSTSKHQSKVRNLLNELGLTAQFVRVRESLSSFSTLEELYVAAEERACDEYLTLELKRMERNERARVRRIERKAAASKSAPVLTLISNQGA